MPQDTWSRRITVSTPPFHGGNRSSILLGTAFFFSSNNPKICRFFLSSTYTINMNSTFLFHLSWKTLWRKKARTFLTIFTIGISVLTFLFFLGLQRGYSKAIVRDIDTFGAHLLALPKGCPYEATAVILQGGILPKQLSDDVFLTIQKNPYNF